MSIRSQRDLQKFEKAMADVFVDELSKWDPWLAQQAEAARGLDQRITLVREIIARGE